METWTDIITDHDALKLFKYDFCGKGTEYGRVSNYMNEFSGRIYSIWKRGTIPATVAIGNDLDVTKLDDIDAAAFHLYRSNNVNDIEQVDNNDEKDNNDANNNAKVVNNDNDSEVVDNEDKKMKDKTRRTATKNITATPTIPMMRNQTRKQSRIVFLIGEHRV